MEGLKMMMIDNGTDHRVRCRLISEWYKVDTFVSGKGELLSEIRKNKPDVVLMDMDLYAGLDGIETVQKIRSQSDIPVLYK
jgi:CheY-like chemotaxis protein